MALSIQYGPGGYQPGVANAPEVEASHPDLEPCNISFAETTPDTEAPAPSVDELASQIASLQAQLNALQAAVGQ